MGEDIDKKDRGVEVLCIMSCWNVRVAELIRLLQLIQSGEKNFSCDKCVITNGFISVPTHRHTFTTVDGLEVCGSNKMRVYVHECLVLKVRRDVTERQLRWRL